MVASTVGAAVVTRPEAIATFGQPARTYHYHEYTIMVWNGNLLDRLQLLTSRANPPIRTWPHHE